MADLLQRYNALSASSHRADVALMLQTVIFAPTPSIDSSSRTRLIESILKDLNDARVGRPSRLTAEEAGKALLAVKMLGRDPTGSQTLSIPANLSSLLSLSTSFPDNPQATSEALRAIANAMLLIAPARSTFLIEEVDGGNIVLSMLEKATTAEQIYLCSRILFFCTVSGPPFVQTMVEEEHTGRTIVAIIAGKINDLRDMIVAGTTMAGEALADLLKLVFNLLVHYPKLVDSQPQNQEATEGEDTKVMGDFWNSRLDGLLPPLIRTFATLPPSSPAPIAAPLTHIIHSLITIPVNPDTLPVWQNTRPPEPVDAPAIDVLQRAFDLLELALAHYLPTAIDPDASEVRKKCEAETGDKSLDDVLSPLTILITRLCAGDEKSRARVRHWLVPEDLDRSTSLEGRSDTLGRLLRLLGCVYHPRLKDSVGEMLFAMSDSDALTLSALVGYGNIAGFLFHKGVVNSPFPPSLASGSTSHRPLCTPSGEVINPITGTTVQGPSGLPGMSDEEKEEEMEKLFVLFDRLEKTGAITRNQNPMRKVVQQAMFGEPPKAKKEDD